MLRGSAGASSQEIADQEQHSALAGEFSATAIRQLLPWQLFFTHRRCRSFSVLQQHSPSFR
jgi:hypothetical protein